MEECSGLRGLGFVYHCVWVDQPLQGTLLTEVHDHIAKLVYKSCPLCLISGLPALLLVCCIAAICRSMHYHCFVV